MTRVLLASLGGTIASIRTAPGEPPAPMLDAADLVASAVGVEGVAEVRAASLRAAESSDLELPDVLELRHALVGAVADGFDGMVVTQGTDTLEETAFAMDCLHAGAEPVVFTGAMRTADATGADGPANVLAAVRVAASEAARDAGTLVVMNGIVHAARFVRKSHAQSLEAFRSPGVGAMGRVDEGRVRLAWRPQPMLRRLVPGEGPVPSVALLTASLGDDGRLLDSILPAGYEGVVVEGFGEGHVPPAWLPGLDRLARRIPVVMTSRTGAGEINGGNLAPALSAAGVIPGGGLSGVKVRVLLTLQLWSGWALERIRRELPDWVTPTS